MDWARILACVTGRVDQDPNGLPNQHKGIVDKIASMRDQLDAPSKSYQTYLQQLRDWETRKKAIEGTPDAAGSLRHLDAQNPVGRLRT